MNQTTLKEAQESPALESTMLCGELCPSKLPTPKCSQLAITNSFTWAELTRLRTNVWSSFTSVLKIFRKARMPPPAPPPKKKKKNPVPVYIFSRQIFTSKISAVKHIFIYKPQKTCIYLHSTFWPHQFQVTGGSQNVNKVPFINNRS